MFYNKESRKWNRTKYERESPNKSEVDEERLSTSGIYCFLQDFEKVKILEKYCFPKKFYVFSLAMAFFLLDIMRVCQF